MLKLIKKDFSRIVNYIFVINMRILQFNIEDPFGLYLEKLKPEDIVEFASSINANALVVFARDGWGRTFYRSKFYPKHAKVSDDFLQRLYKACKERGIKLVAMICHTSNKYLATIHPNWIQRNVKDEIIALDSVKGEELHWPLMCLNSGFLDYCLGEIDEVKNYADYLMLDSFRYQPDFHLACYCENCRREFKKTHNLDLPNKEDWNHPSWWDAWFWRYDVVINSIKKIKERAGDKPLVYNSHPAGWGWRANTIVEKASEYIDVVFAESSEVDFQPLGFLYEISKLTFGLGAKEVWTTRNAFHIFNTPYLLNKYSLELGVWEIVAAGASPMFLVFLSTYMQNKEKLGILGDIFRRVEIVEEHIGGAKPEEEITIVYSNASRDFYGRDNPDKYNNEVRGFFYALFSMNYQVGFIGDRKLCQQKPNSKLLILPNKIIMGKEIHTIKSYIKEGGKVLATFLTSLYSEDLDGRRAFKRSDFLLADEFGAHFYGLKKLRWLYFNNLLFGGYEEDAGYVATVKPEESEILGVVYEGLFEHGYEYALGRAPPPKGGEISYAIKKSAIYLPFQFGRALFAFGYPEYFKLLRGLIGFESLLSSNYGEFVKLIAWRKNNKLLIHIINHAVNQRINNASPVRAKFTIGMGQSVNPIRDIIPLRNLIIKIREEFSSAYLVLKEKEVKVDVKNGETLVSIPELGTYDLLILEK